MLAPAEAVKVLTVGAVHDDAWPGELPDTVLKPTLQLRHTQGVTKRSAAIYARISSDDGTALGVERQVAECRSLAERLGWGVGAVLLDNDVSAFSGRRRPQYELLLESLVAGRVDAVLAWHPDRLHRRPRDAERFLDVIEATGALVETVSAGTLDFSTPSGRAVARTLVAWSNYESEHKSERIRSASAERAQAGRPAGRRAYGWRREHVLDEQGRRVGSRDVVDPAQAAVVHEMARRVAAGEAVRSITGPRSRIGSHAASPMTCPRCSRSPALRSRSTVVRTVTGCQTLPSGEGTPRALRSLYDQVRALLTDPARRTTASNAVRHLLSGLARCGAAGCDGTMRVHTVGGITRYTCEACYGVSRRQDQLDEFVSEVVVARLSRPDAADLLGGDDDEQARAAAREAAGLRARLDLAADQYAEGGIDGQQLARITARLRPQLADAEDRARVPSNGQLLDGLLGERARRRWEELPLARRRAVIDALMVVRVHSVGKGYRYRPGDAMVGVDVEWFGGPSARWRDDTAHPLGHRPRPRRRAAATRAGAMPTPRSAPPGRGREGQQVGHVESRRSL